MLRARRAFLFLLVGHPAARVLACKSQRQAHEGHAQGRPAVHTRSRSVTLESQPTLMKQGAKEVQVGGGNGGKRGERLNSYGQMIKDT